MIVPQEHYAHCESLVRERDRDLWLACLFAPQSARQHIHAVYAFALEARDVCARVTQPLIGEMRLRWWADALAADATTGEGARAHPAADALLDTIERFALPRDEIATLLDAHIFDLYDDQMPSLAALEDYCRATAAGPMRWAARILGAPASSAFDDAGVALGLARVLRAAAGPFVPRDLLARHGADLHADSSRLRAALFELRETARAHYDNARRTAAVLSVGREALLPAATVPLFLEQMSRNDYDPLHALTDPSPLRRQWRLWRAARGAGL